ncbi:MAG: hypothetical protein PVI79_03825 [Gammaproteobacteria bacterium]|jgi:hypothetical protein
MINLGLNKIRVLAAATLVALAVASAPAKANHDADIIVPLAAIIAIGALAGHQHHGYYRYTYQSRYRPQYGSHYRPHYGSHYRPYRHSHSHGGYREPRYKHHRNW